MSDATLVSWIRVVLDRAKRKLTRLKGGGNIVKQGAEFGSLTNDTEILADRVLGEYFQTAFARHHDVARVTVEGLGDQRVRPGDGLWICVDPIDGSLNYKTRGGLIGNPYMAVVTVLLRADAATFDDVICGVVFDLRPKISDFWCVFREGGRMIARDHHARELRTLRETRLVPGAQTVMAETYYPANREKLLALFAGEKGNFSRFGSAAYEMALVSSGNAAAFLCCSQKNHELGATQMLVRAAGGVAVDWEGKSIGTRPYEFNAQTPIILAANASIAQQIVSRLHSLELQHSPS